MGRAGRPKNGMPPGLEDLEEHGLPEGWHGFWHGQQEEIVPRIEASGIDEKIRNKMYKEALLPGEKIDLLASLPLTEQTENLRGHPVLEALWMNERDQMPDLLRELYGNKSEGELRDVWEKYVLSSLEQLHGRVSQNPATDPASFLAGRPTTLLETMIAAREIDHDQLFQLLQENNHSEEFDDIFYKHVLPAAHSLLSGANGYSLDLDRFVLSKLQSQAAKHGKLGGLEERALEQHEWLLQGLEHVDFDRLDEFRAAPMEGTQIGLQGTSIEREYWKQLLGAISYRDLVPGSSVPGSSMSSVANKMKEVSRGIMAQQILRLLLGIKKDDKDFSGRSRSVADFDAAWAAHLDDPSNRSPLENLRPIFESLGEEEELDALIREVPEALHPRYKTGKVRDEIYQHLQLPSRWGGSPGSLWGKHIADIIRGALR